MMMCMRSLAKQTKVQTDFCMDQIGKLSSKVDQLTTQCSKSIDTSQMVFRKLLQYSRGAFYITEINQQKSEFEKIRAMLVMSEKKNEILQKSSNYDVSPARLRESNFMTTSPEKPLKLQMVFAQFRQDDSSSDDVECEEIQLPEKIKTNANPKEIINF